MNSALPITDRVESPDGKAWFADDRFGMFIHFGLYASGARHEWLQHREEISGEDYAKYFEIFNPDLYDPREWARRAREAGMKYVVLTAKHHEGFCLWDSQFTDYKATNTPYGKDLLKPYVEAFRAEGLKVGFYYSLIDWNHADFPLDAIHPLRNHPDALEINKSRDVRKYAAYMRNQVTELLTGFGEISVIWFDFSYPNREYRGMPGKGRNDWESEELIALVRQLQPNIIVGDRLDLPTDGNHPKDLATPEQYTPRVAPTWGGKPVRWEVCHTFSGSWGYHRDETTWKDAGQLINLLIDTVSLGGNLLMNVGPTARGTFDVRAEQALGVYRDWMHVNARSIYGAGPSAFVAPNGCKFTQSGNRLYLHVQTWPFRHIHIDGLGGRVKYAQFLHDASEIHWLDPKAEVDSNIGVAVGSGMLTLELPVIKPDVIVPVIELILNPYGGPMSIEEELFATMTPVIADLAESGNGAVSLGGSRAKHRSDTQSDYDFRVYAEQFKGPELRQTKAWQQFDAVLQGWEAKGLRLDGVWARRYAGVQSDLDAWIAGKGVPKHYEWTIWGYHLPTDLAHQHIIVDPHGILAGWKAQLASYPDAMQRSVIDQYLGVLRYWATDYHYASKVTRRDLVFLVGLTGKLVNAILQVVFAVNRTYYPGDGLNLEMAKDFVRLPPDFIARMTTILEPGDGVDRWQRQRAEFISVIADLEVLAAD